MPGQIEGPYPEQPQDQYSFAMAPRKAAALKKESQTAASPIRNLGNLFRKSSTQETVQSKSESEAGTDGPCAKRGQAKQGTRRRRTSAKLAAVVQAQSQENVNAPSQATKHVFQTETDKYARQTDRHADTRPDQT